MAFYLVRAKPSGDLASLRDWLESGEIADMEPFGITLHESLNNARVEGDTAVWEEEDYCRPPLDAERKAVLDQYFTDITVETVHEGEGWQRIEHLPSMWDSISTP